MMKLKNLLLGALLGSIGFASVFAFKYVAPNIVGSLPEAMSVSSGYYLMVQSGATSGLDQSRITIANMLSGNVPLPPTVPTFWSGDGYYLTTIQTGVTHFYVGEQSTAIGDNAIGMGFRGVANGNNSVAMQRATANGQYCFAFGNDSIAGNSSNFDVAIGDNVQAIGGDSLAMGYNTRATKNYSVAIGNATVSSGIGATSFGHSTIAGGADSTAMGNATQALGTYSTAMGFGSIAKGNYSTAFGNTTKANVGYSVAMGDSTIASGIASTAIGASTTAKGNYSTAMGDSSTTNGVSSVAMGRSCTASGDNTISMGYYNTANGQYSTAWGNTNEARGIGSTSAGYQSLSVGLYSFALGYQTTSLSDSSFVIGHNNVGIAQGLFEVGNGNLGDEKNAFTILQDGKVGVGISAPTYALDVVGQINSSAGYCVAGACYTITTGTRAYPGSTGKLVTESAVDAKLNVLASDLGDVMTTGSYIMTATGVVNQGSWRMQISGGNLSFQVYTGGVWTEKGFFTAN